MRDVMWICFLLSCFSEAWSLDPETNGSTPMNVTFFVSRNLTYNLGSQVNLTCNTSTWNDTIYVIWHVKLKNRECLISMDYQAPSKRIVDKCKDGKSLQNVSSSQSYLHIPNFSMEDVGTYKCEVVYAGGKEDHIFNIKVIVPPQTCAWLEPKNNKIVAVCKAERGNPAANISWSHTGNILLYEALSQSDGLVTVESQLELPEDANTTNLSCAVSHPSWDQIKTVVPETEKANFPWLYILIVVVVVVTVVVVGSVSFAVRKLITLWRHQQPDIPSLKLPEVEYVEEVEPYASYVQRVNSIYNSSADLCA